MVVSVASLNMLSSSQDVTAPKAMPRSMPTTASKQNWAIACKQGHMLHPQHTLNPAPSCSTLSGSVQPCEWHSLHLHQHNKCHVELNADKKSHGHCRQACSQACSKGLSSVAWNDIYMQFAATGFQSCLHAIHTIACFDLRCDLAGGENCA
eukprot:GHRR01035492.1.p1 GENE.GHRR01035492.1~~GHRR01035492.1.p1  ORF type:complete len:151 (-),score=14.50 GHRR01035492.1:651-1103(-)